MYKLDSFFFVIIIITYTFDYGYIQQVNCNTISDCDQLFAIPSDSNINYIVSMNITCSTYLNTPISGYSGTFDGNGYTITNLTINGRGLFFDVKSGGIIRNIKFLNLRIEDNSSSPYVALIGYGNNCTISNITLDTTSSSITNSISSFSIYTASIVGYLTNLSTISNCVIQNTIINTIKQENGCNVGGIVGYLLNSTMTNCHNLGFVGNPSKIIVNSTGVKQIGGLIGGIDESTVTNSGVYQGVISTDNYTAGALIGLIGENCVLSQLYGGSKVSLIGCTSECGGIAGSVNGNGKLLNIYNVYFKGNISSPSYTGGLIGHINAEDLEGFLRNSYASCNFSNSNQYIGNIIGVVSYPTTFDLSQVYYFDQKNLQGIGSGSGYINGNPLSLSCLDLYGNVSLFDNNTWIGDALKIEYIYNPGNCSCTNCTSTQTPSTLTPSSLTPSSQIPSTNIPSTLAPSTYTPSTAPPSTSVPSTIKPSTLTPSSPSTNIP
eukprot:TRINITY_DN11037_c0_g1_i1.p1 TRINITY_DN11037_c0_g1~~TRINITY_DN11037_c0_g1_i1.p1  ORF type:complete len:491 (+),score=73.45 TRINITY_DN11037_c0_g1_i1:21-1493(+)